MSAEYIIDIKLLEYLSDNEVRFAFSFSFTVFTP